MRSPRMPSTDNETPLLGRKLIRRSCSTDGLPTAEEERTFGWGSRGLPMIMITYFIGEPPSDFG